MDLCNEHYLRVPHSGLLEWLRRGSSHLPRTHTHQENPVQGCHSCRKVVRARVLTVSKTGAHTPTTR